MTDSKMICDIQKINRFLHNEMSLDESKDFEIHLDDCESCRQQITDSAADQSRWEETKQYLGQESDLDPDLPECEVESLSFLNPSENPRMLGRFGGYEIAGLIGQGGMGVVLKGFDQSLNRYVAIKVLAPQLATRGSARVRFGREAQAAAAVVHDNVVAIHGVSEAAGLPFLVMPYVRGESLQKRLDREGMLSLIEIIRIGHQISSGLAAAHAQGLVHRDIKPANILLPQGVQRVLITDFGLARAVDDSQLTGTGAIAGTPQFMSPEQARGESINERSDLFSLGTVLYSMCTGRSPFRAENSFGILRRIIEDQPRRIREINAEIPDWLERLICRLHTKSPEDRFASAAELSKLLEGCLAHLQNPTVPLPEQLIAPKPKRRRGRWVGVLGATALFAICGWIAVDQGMFDKNARVPSELESQPRGLVLDANTPQQDDSNKLELSEEFVSTFPLGPKEDLSLRSLLRGKWEWRAVRRNGERLSLRTYSASRRKAANRKGDSTFDEGAGRSGVDAPIPFGTLEFRDQVVLVTDREDGSERFRGMLEIDQGASKNRMAWLDQETGQTRFEMEFTYSVEFELADHVTLQIEQKEGSDESPKEISFEIELARVKTDPIYLRNQANHLRQVIRSCYDEKSDKLNSYCEHLYALSKSQKAEAELRERFQQLRQEIGDAWTDKSAEGFDATQKTIGHLLELADAERVTRFQMINARQSESDRKEHLRAMNKQMTALLKEGNQVAAEEMRIAILSTLQSDDQDYDRLEDLRREMIQLHLKGKQDEADRICQTISELELRLKTRYQDVERHNEINRYWEEVLRIHHLANRWREEGRVESAEKAMSELQTLKQKICEEFGEVAWLVFAAENLETDHADAEKSTDSKHGNTGLDDNE